MLDACGKFPAVVTATLSMIIPLVPPVLTSEKAVIPVPPLLLALPPGPGGNANSNGGTGMTAFSDVSTGGTSGIIIDNVAVTTAGNFPQASSIYFSWLAPAGPSAIGGGGSTFQCNSATTGGFFQKLTQAGLQYSLPKLFV